MAETAASNEKQNKKIVVSLTARMHVKRAEDERQLKVGIEAAIGANEIVFVNVSSGVITASDIYGWWNKGVDAVASMLPMPTRDIWNIWDKNSDGIKFIGEDPVPMVRLGHRDGKLRFFLHTEAHNGRKSFWDILLALKELGVSKVVFVIPGLAPT